MPPQKSQEIKKGSRAWKKLQTAKRRKRRDSRRDIVWKRIRHGVYLRCNYKEVFGYQYYGGKGIECRITYLEIARIWFRDVAWMMKDPELDRIDANDHYTFENCRFIPKKENFNRVLEAQRLKREQEGDTSFDPEQYEREKIEQ